MQCFGQALTSQDGQQATNANQETYRYITMQLEVGWGGTSRDVGFLLTTHERQQVPIQLPPKIEAVVTIRPTYEGGNPGVVYLSLKASSGSR